MNHSKKQKKQVVILLGPPGAGKGTQAELLAETFNFYHWETSRIVGKIIAQAPEGDFVTIEGKKYYYEKERQLRREGKLWDPPFLVYFVKKKLKEVAEKDKGVALIGSPRTLYEGEKVIPLLKELYGEENIKVVLIKLKPEDSVWRNTHRRECELVRHPILYSEETASLTKCPLDGSKIVKRKDDNPEVIRARLKEYEKRTFPLVDYLKKQGLEIKEVDGSPPPAVVFENILEAIKQKRENN